MPARIAWTSASLLALPVMKLRVLWGVGMVVFVGCEEMGRGGEEGIGLCDLVRWKTGVR